MIPEVLQSAINKLQACREEQNALHAAQAAERKQLERHIRRLRQLDHDRDAVGRRVTEADAALQDVQQRLLTPWRGQESHWNMTRYVLSNMVDLCWDRRAWLRIMTIHGHRIGPLGYEMVHRWVLDADTPEQRGRKQYEFGIPGVYVEVSTPPQRAEVIHLADAKLREIGFILIDNEDEAAALLEQLKEVPQ